MLGRRARSNWITWRTGDLAPGCWEITFRRVLIDENQDRGERAGGPGQAVCPASWSLPGSQAGRGRVAARRPGAGARDGEGRVAGRSTAVQAPQYCADFSQTVGTHENVVCRGRGRRRSQSGDFSGGGHPLRYRRVRQRQAHVRFVGFVGRGRESTPLRRAVANTGRSGTAGKSDQAIAITELLLAHGANRGHVNRSGGTLLESTRTATIQNMLRSASRGSTRPSPST